MLCTVVPSPWPPSAARVDAEYRAHVDREAAAVLERARERLAGDVEVTPVVHHARSVPAGLLEVAERHEARLIVPAPPVGTLGSTTNRLLHSSHVPVALAPHGFRAAPDARVRASDRGVRRRQRRPRGRRRGRRRAGRGHAAARLVRRAAARALHGRRRPRGRRLGGREWVAEIQAAQQAALDRVRELPDGPADCEAVVGRGSSWEEALDDIDWERGDVLVVGSSSVGPIARVFLGSRSEKLVQHSPVPTVVVPRSTAPRYARCAALRAPS